MIPITTPLHSLRFLSVATIFLLSLTSIMAETNAKQNVLVFFIDDLRPELACYGVETIKSPNIDTLATKGVLFERAYCQQAICAPSRISMLSGQRPDKTGIYDLFTPVRKKFPDIMTLPRYFKEMGYETASFGKVYHHHIDDKLNWSELPDSPGDIYADPKTLESIKQSTADAKKKKLSVEQIRTASKGPATEMADVADEAYRDGAVAAQAIQSLRTNKDKPFFMCVGFAKPHLPFSAPKRYWDLYPSEQFTVPDRNLPKGTPTLAVTKWGELRGYRDIPADGPLNDEQTKELRHGYAACVSYTDAQVGKVMAELDRLGLRESTIVVLWGDHGYKLGDYGLWCKHTNLELDTRVPLIISAPGMAKDKRTMALVEIVDLFPTLAKLTGGEIPASCDGKSLETVLEDPSKAFLPYAVSQYPRGSTMGYTLRNDRWRYTEWINYDTGKIIAKELYDHADSQMADRNLVEDPAHAELVATLSKQLNSSDRAQNRTKTAKKPVKGSAKPKK